MAISTDPLILALNAERLRQGLSAEQWADRAGVNRNTVHRLIRGERLGHMASVRALAYALGLELCIRPLSKAAGP